MKKLSLIASLGCLLTVSGVYAQWIYGQATAGSVSESIIPQMAGVGDSSKKGTISVVTSGLTIVIDDGGDYVPTLKIAGQVEIDFTANKGADADVVANGIKMSYTLSVTENWLYDSDGDGVEDREIFTLSNCENVAVNGGNATKEAVITAETMSSYISLNIPAGFKLDTRAKYDAFKQSLNKASSLFTLEVKEVI